MKYSLIIITSFFISFSSIARTADYFKVDFDVIEKEFVSINEIEVEINKSGAAQDAPLFSAFELPVDSTEKVFPIMGIPTFWLVFAPTCASNCIAPCSGSFVGGVSFAYIRYFGKNEEESKQALAGCMAGQFPIFIYAGLYALLLSGGW